jgi:hypothetical protein
MMNFKVQKRNITKIVVGIYLVMFTSTITAQTSTRTIKEGNRTIVEETRRSSYGNTYYQYSIADISERVDNIKKKKKEFNYNAEYTYPIYKNQQLMKDEYKKLNSLYHTCLGNNKKKLSSNDIQYDGKALINDDGSVICYKIIAKTPLLELFTAKELLNIFDTINSFRFTTPLMKYESTGYLETMLGYF